MTSGMMPWAASVRITPIWAKPRAAPPPSASPMVGRIASGRTPGVASAVESVARPRANNPSKTNADISPGPMIGPGQPFDKPFTSSW